MINNRKLILDTFCEVYDLLKSYADGEFWNFQEHINSNEFSPGAIYLIGREEFKNNTETIRELASSETILPILSNPAEGSDTMTSQICRYGITELVNEKKILIIAGGYMPDTFPYLYYENFLPKILDYDENLEAILQCDKIYTKTNKSYKFLFLNGRQRPHRKYLLDTFKQSGLLEQSLWTNLDDRPIFPIGLTLDQDAKHIFDIPFEINYLPKKYEVDRYQERIGTTISNPTRDLAVKFNLFNREWGEIYLSPEPYIDTYFSLVTETVFDYPYSFRTEKIWKPIAMGHPFIVATNAGYYRDMHNIGFQTFGHIIDESFDSIENNHDRLNRIVQIVEDLCQQDLDQFLKECYNVCKYNQQHLAEMRPKVRQEFPDRFFQFLNKHTKV